jgi:mono/diheme cytochrome c family protein
MKNEALNCFRGAVAALFALTAAGCRNDLADQGHHEPLEASREFADGGASRPQPPHTLARDQWDEDDLFVSGMSGGQPAELFPAPVTRQQIERGRERYEIFCAVCHGLTGDGDGMAVQRGFPKPPSFHEERLRAAPAGHFFSVITSGYGMMYPYGGRVPPADRWAIVSYIRTLQLGRRATLADATPEGRRILEGEPHE